MTETLREEVLSVLASDLSSNEIAHFSGINQSIISRLRTGKANIDRLGLLSAEKIASVIDPNAIKQEKHEG